MDDEVDTRYGCPICCEVLKKPVLLTTCHHRYCEECIRSLISDPAPLCPMCRKPFTPAQCQNDTALENEIKKTSVTCKGCKQKLMILYFNSHALACPKRIKKAGSSSAAPLHPQSSPNRQTFKCPYCPSTNLTCAALREHVTASHASASNPVVCPICTSMPWGNPNQTSTNFLAHLALRHRFDYDTYVDFEQDDEASLQAVIEASKFQY